MNWFRSLAVRLWASWHARRLLRQLKGDNYANLESLSKLQGGLGSTNEAELEKERPYTFNSTRRRHDAP